MLYFRILHAQGFVQNKKAALEGGSIAGNARMELEKKTGSKIATKDNYKEIPESQKRKSIKGANENE
ncbi:MAG: hypothetical protein A2X43_12430 [Candidatus Margulisbacteria bacterium GWD2_39_127]|nr:MAG: hypothetical protein A2X43_12430 [Candidatus Margulisbacteria bacterium GWD2_39_127]